MKARQLLTPLLLAAGTAGLAGCVVYPEPVAVQPSVTVVRPAPYYYGYGRYYGYGPRYRYYGPRRDWD